MRHHDAFLLVPTHPAGLHVTRLSHDPFPQRLFVVNANDRSVDVLDIRDPTNPVKVAAIDASALGASANSVDVKRGIVAVAIAADVAQDNGVVAFYRADDLKLLNTVAAGALPDMVTFMPNGQYVLVANEDEPDDYYLVCPSRASERSASAW